MKVLFFYLSDVLLLCSCLIMLEYYNFFYQYFNRAKLKSLWFGDRPITPLIKSISSIQKCFFKGLSLKDFDEIGHFVKSFFQLLTVQLLHILPEMSKEIGQEIYLGVSKFKLSQQLLNPVDMILRLSAFFPKCGQ